MKGYDAANTSTRLLIASIVGNAIPRGNPEVEETLNRTPRLSVAGRGR